jgi:homeobox protein cut-like
MSKLQTLAQFWQAFNLTQVQQGLDEIATEITAQQDESDTSRKALIELIKDFKRDNSEDVRSAVGPLVKAFQNEVDFLSRRSKSAEKAFFDIYKQLVDVADPTPVLDQVTAWSILVALCRTHTRLQLYRFFVSFT